jgi:hypothetical protein
MITLEVKGGEGLGGVYSYLEFFSELKEIDLSETEQDIFESVAQNRRLMAINGIGSDGKKMEPIMLETQERRARARKGSGPPLAPNESLSRIANPQITIAAGNGGVMIEELWADAGFLALHAAGIHFKSGFKQRNAITLDESSIEEIREIIMNFIDAKRVERREKITAPNPARDASNNKMLTG